MSAAISPTTLDRIMTYLRQLVRAELPRLSFLGLYEYAVQSGSGNTYELAPTDNSISLPGSKGFPLRLTLATADLPKGALVILCFLNGDPSKPAIVGAAPLPTNMTIDATATLSLGTTAAAVKLAGGGAAVARVGDPITVTSAIAGSVSGATCTITAAQLLAAGIQIQSGSSKVSSG